MRANSLVVGAVASGSLLLALPAVAAEWDKSAGLTMSAYYSDNICFSGQDPKEWGVGTVTPTASLRGQGARANVALRAAMEYNTIRDTNLECQTGQARLLSNRRSFIPSLRFESDLELIEDWVTLFSDAFVGRNAIDPFAAGGLASLNNLDNINVTYQYGAGAVLQRRLFQRADMRLLYRYSEQYNQVQLFGDNTENRVEFDLGTDPSQGRLSLGLGGRYSYFEFNETVRGPAFDNTLSSAFVRAALQLSSSWQLNGTVGEEWNNFTRSDGDIDGTYWDAGLRWAPNERIEVEAGNGQRFFGSTPRYAIAYRHKRSELNLRYARTVMMPRNLRGGQGFLGEGFDPDFEPDLDLIPGEPGVISGAPTFLGNTPVVNQRLSVAYRFSGRRSTLSISGSRSLQIRLRDNAEADFVDARVILSRDLASNLTGSLSTGWRERTSNRIAREEFEGITFGIPSEAWWASIRINRRLSNYTTTSLTYRFTSQRSDFALAQFDENRVTLSARHEF